MSLLDWLRGLFRRERSLALVGPTNKRAVAIAAACAICLPLTASFEGLRTHPYKDVTGTPTVCYGDTEVAMRVYTAGQCGDLLRQRLARDYAPRLLDCVPAFTDPQHRNHYAALLDASYNSGVAAACRSPMARSFNLGRWSAGCGQFPGWYVTSKGRRLTGLVRRRLAEKALCLRVDANAESETDGTVYPRTTVYDGMPPERMRGPASLTVSMGTVDACGTPGPGLNFEACVRGDLIHVPNPCDYPTEKFAELLCHEKAHRAFGWPADHGA